MEINKEGNPKQQKERVSIFIDGSNLYHSLRSLNVKLDIAKLIRILAGKKELINVYYYIAPLDFKTNPKKYWKHQKFLNTLRRMPRFNVVLCRMKKIKSKTGDIEFFVKGDDTLLVRDLLVGAFRNLYDIAIIVSGDEDFAPIIKTLQELGKKVGNAYFKRSSSEALRKECNFSISISKLIRNKFNKKKDSALP